MKAREVKRAKLVAKYAAACTTVARSRVVPRVISVSSESLVFNSARWHPRVLSPA